MYRLDAMREDLPAEVASTGPALGAAAFLDVSVDRCCQNGEALEWFANTSVEDRATVLEQLCERAASLFRRDPEAARRIARVAASLASLTPAEGREPRRINDRRALAWASLANAERVCDDRQAAEAAWGKVEPLLRNGTGDSLLKARLLDLEASLRREQAQFPRAAALLRRAKALCLRRGRGAMAARIGLNLADTLYKAGSFDGAIHETLASVHELDLQGEPILALTAFHNLVTFLAEGGSPRLALVVMDDGLALYNLSSNPIDAVRGLWLRGKLCAALQEIPAAVACLDQVKKEFVGLALPFEASLAALELAALLLVQERTTEVKALAEEMYPVFVAQQIPREASAALLLFVEAARREAATVAAVEHLLGDLKGRLAPNGRAAGGKFLT